MEKRERRALLEEMLAVATWPPAELERRLAWSADPAYWTGLLAGASIGRAASRIDATSAPGEHVASAAASIHADGYGMVPAVLGPETLRLLNSSIDSVLANGWPPVFAWVFDVMWSVTRAAAVRHLVAATLGEGARQIPHVWVNVVSDQGKGWASHVDGGDGSDPRARLTLWIALTDAGLDDGCIYLVPRSAAPADLYTFDWSTECLRQADAVRMLEATRAMPVSAGSALAWNFDLLHWSGVRRGTSGARRSLSVEFLAGGATAAPDEVPLLPCGADDPLPTLDERLRYIATVLLEYNVHETAMRRFAPLAEALLTRAV